MDLLNRYHLYVDRDQFVFYYVIHFPLSILVFNLIVITIYGINEISRESWYSYFSERNANSISVAKNPLIKKTPSTDIRDELSDLYLILIERLRIVEIVQDIFDGNYIIAEGIMNYLSDLYLLGLVELGINV